MFIRTLCQEGLRSGYENFYGHDCSVLGRLFPILDIVFVDW